RGVQALQADRESLHHTTTISRIIEETFAEKGYKLEDFRLNQERVTTVVGKLVDELPNALHASRTRSQEFDLNRTTQHLAGYESHELSTRNEPIIVAELDHSLDDQVVEQKVSHTLEMLTNHSSHRGPAHFERGNQLGNHQSLIHNNEANGKEQSL